MITKPLSKLWEDDVKKYAKLIESTLPKNHNLDTDDIYLIADMLVRSNRKKLKKTLEKLNFSAKAIKMQVEREEEE